MINGEGTYDTLSGVASPDPSPLSSPRYSSCGESEFDRYCSANSLMGTPSMCSSSFRTFNDCVDSEFGSLRSLGFGDGVNLEDFRLEAELDRKFDTDKQPSSSVGDGDPRISYWEDKSNTKQEINVKGVDLYDNSEDFSVLEISAVNSRDLDVSGFLEYGNVSNNLEDGLSEGDEQEGFIPNRKHNESKVLLSEAQNLQKESFNLRNGDNNMFSHEIGSSSNYLLGNQEDSHTEKVKEEGSGLDFQIDVKEVGGLSEEEETVSRDDEHSEGEDSMFDCGTDNERDTDSLHKQYVQNRQENIKNVNSLVMNSSVAFGSDDWDDFEQESMSNKFEEMQQLKHDLQRDPKISTPQAPMEFPGVRGSEQEEDANQIFAANGQLHVADQPADNLESCSASPNSCLELGGSEQRGEVGNIRHSLVMNSSVAFGSDDWDDFEQESVSNKFGEMQQLKNDLQSDPKISSPAAPMEFPGVRGSEQEADANQIIAANGRLHVDDQPADNLESCSAMPNSCLELGGSEQRGVVGNILHSINSFRGTNESAGFQCGSLSNVDETQLGTQVQKDPLSYSLNAISGGIEIEHPSRSSKEVIVLDEDRALVSRELGIPKSKSKLDPLSDTTTNQPSFEEALDEEETSYENKLPELMFEKKTENIFYGSSFSIDLFEDLSAPIKTENLLPNQSYDDVVNEMEEILLDSVDSPGMGLYEDNQIFQSYLIQPSRDGGSTSSTSGTDGVFSRQQRPLRIDGIEVVGAKQKKGDVSLGERLVGVKEYTVYIIRVWSGKDTWVVERRYRDFFTLFRRLKSLFTDRGLVLPSPWSSVERESRKIFGSASPDVVAERSTLIQECLCSLLHSRISSSPPSALVLFLSPEDAFPSSPASNTPSSWSSFLRRGAETENISTLGKTVSLMVEMRPYKSTRQLLEAQNYTCAGCHRHFDDGKTMMQDFVQSLGWGKPRLCEYTGQLFCSSCHTSDTAILPARVLHHWDFTQYPVSQLAKSYLDSIHDQPMLCVSAVNPFLFSKVPSMLLIMNIRKKVGAMLPYVRCPFRRSINKALGSRRYLLESNDFFALKDLIDLSKGAFAALPVMVETASRKIHEHITEQCLICCDVGVPCGARQACNDPSSLIFPFQEGEIEKCKSCQAAFHHLCFEKITDCPCGFQFRADEPSKKAIVRVGNDDEDEGPLDLIKKKLSSALPVAFLSGLFTNSRPENQQGHKKDSDTVISMGYLPSTSL